MNLVEVKQVPSRRTDWEEIITQFVESRMNAAEIKDYPHKSAKSCEGALHQAIKNHWFDYAVDSKLVNGKVYIYKTETTK